MGVARGACLGVALGDVSGVGLATALGRAALGGDLGWGSIGYLAGRGVEQAS